MHRPLSDRIAAILFVCSQLFAAAATAQSVTIEERDGAMWEVTRRPVRKQVASTEWTEGTETVYTEQYVTEPRDQVRTVFAPVTEYRCEPRWHNWWNPFSRPHIAYHMRPVTRWETRTETYQVPVTYRRMVPETRVVRTPRSTVRWEEQEQIVSRRLVTPSRRTTVPRGFQSGTPVGGISRFEQDPPRRPSSGTILR